MPESETFLKYRSTRTINISLLKFLSSRTGYNRAAGSYNEIREVVEVETRYDQAAGSWMSKEGARLGTPDGSAPND